MTILDKALTQIGYAEKEINAGTATEALPHLQKAREFIERVELPEEDNAEGLFSGSATDEEVIIIGGTPAGNPNGVTFTVADAVAWWKTVFADGLNVSQVRPTLLPGSKVLTEAGLAKARALATDSTNYADEAYNPLELEVIA